jgi:hypothetical protein
MDKLKRTMTWVGIAVIAIVKLPFTVSSFITTGIEYFLLWLASIMCGKCGDPDVREVWNYAMDGSISGFEACAEIIEDMKL